jgi:hypothetical protein
MGCAVRCLLEARACCHDELQGARCPRREAAMVAATDIGFVKMRVSKVVGVRDADRVCEFVVLNELDGDRHLLIQIGSAEAFALAASLCDMRWAAR